MACKASIKLSSDWPYELSANDNELLDRDRLLVEARMRARRTVPGETEGVNCCLTGGSMAKIELLSPHALGGDELELLLEVESRERAREKRRSSKMP